MTALTHHILSQPGEQSPWPHISAPVRGALRRRAARRHPGDSQRGQSAAKEDQPCQIDVITNFRASDSLQSNRQAYALTQFGNAANINPFHLFHTNQYISNNHQPSATFYEDAMIAAIAKVNGLTVVTRNVSDFSSFAIGILNPFEVVRN